MPSPWARRLRESLGQIEPTSQREDLQGFPELERELTRTSDPRILQILGGEHNRLRGLLPEHVEAPSPPVEGRMPPATASTPFMGPVGIPQRWRKPGQEQAQIPTPALLQNLMELLSKPAGMSFKEFDTMDRQYRANRRLSSELGTPIPEVPRGYYEYQDAVAGRPVERMETDRAMQARREAEQMLQGRTY